MKILALGLGHCLGALVCCFALAAPATAQGFDVPDGFTETLETEAAESREWRPIMTVRPEKGPFSELSAIHLHRVTGQVKDPKSWLKDRLTLAMGRGDSDPGAIFTSPDSPFADPYFDSLRKTIPELMQFLEKLGRLPLDACDKPRAGYNATGTYHELYCVFAVGPVRQFIVLRLQKAKGRWYYTDVRTMNERRLRQLLAIADTFHVKR